jgi:biopolymer transport protein ExbB
MTRTNRWFDDLLCKPVRASALVLGCLLVVAGGPAIAGSPADPVGGSVPPSVGAAPPAAGTVSPAAEAAAPPAAAPSPASELPAAASSMTDASVGAAPLPAAVAPAAPPPSEAAVPGSESPTFAPVVPAADAPDHSSELEAAQLPHDLSPWGMFMAADVVVKSVMIGLALASVLTWTVWFSKSLELMFARRSLKRAAAELKSSTTLSEAAQRAAKKSRVAAALIDQAHLELRLSADVLDKAGILDRIGSRLQDVSSAAGRSINRGTGLLATIGSTAPFIGLFGTVWGIMNSFIGISKAQTTNLAVVAPGIAEALLATALGLVAAIPAVIIYNQFSRSIGSYKASLGEISSEVMRHVSRDLDRGAKVPQRQAAAE